MKFLKTLVANILGTLIAFGVLLFFGFLFLIAMASSVDQKPVVRSNSILTVDLIGTLPERVSGDPLSQLILGESQIDLHSTISAIDAAAVDNKIKGIWIRTNGLVSSWASLEAVRRSLESFKESGKPIVASSRNYFMMESEYFLASVADSLFLEPESIFEFNGFAMTSTFFGDVMEKLGVKAEVVRAGKFKGAVEPYTRNAMSAENREQYQALLDGVERSFVSSVSTSRNLTEDAVRTLMDRDAMFSSRDALESGLIDGLLFDDELQDKLKRIADVDSSKSLPTISASSYSKTIRSNRASDKIAIVHITGTIMSGGATDSPLMASGTAGAEDIVKAIRQARDRQGVKAMVVRINSPGGFAPAGDAMLRELERTAQDMPVVVSMGDLAASGGYWIATGARRIFAEKNTITGSIGVFSLFFNVSGLLEDKIGITFDEVTTGPHADMFSGMRSYSEAEREILGRATDETYQSFLTKVAISRKLSVEEVDEIAQGRVWTGEDAVRVGLVDEIGGLDAALSYAAREAKLDSTEFQIVRYPTAKTFLDQFMSSPGAAVKAIGVASGFSEAMPVNRYVDELRSLVDSHGRVQALYPWNVSIR